MLPASHSVQNLQSGGLMLHPPPRSRSHVNLAASAGMSGLTNSNGHGKGNGLNENNYQNAYASPGFMRSASAGPAQTSPAPHHGFVRSASEMPPSPSLRMQGTGPTQPQSHEGYPRPQRSASGSHTPVQSTFAHNPPPVHHSASVSHFGLYDSRLVANTINKIESSTSAGTLVSATSGVSTVPGTAPPGSSHGPENDAWTAVCIRTLPLL